ncbi:uncharacterized protein N7483_005083 [Penicillium malachiteum]|uniref:uncharacterized protein n=1 Tax=Penicillium malachiteum TaxID=1324776 RepID=UPI0025472BDA|nr:uncharacterized protein N7483_005083 [Penicillium malachiteum]KAJ5730575.1 hypothetical protein N7483_005083 [Penicillium malachiteum]
MAPKVHASVKLTTLSAFAWFGSRLFGFRLESLLSLATWLCASESFFFQNSSAIFDEPLGNRITHWVNTIPNDGLLHFFGLFGSEYLVPTSIESLSDVLTNRSYQFQKTSGFRRYGIRFFGDGIVVQESDKHKQSRKSFLQAFNQRQVDRLKPVLSSKASQIVQYVWEKCTLYENGEKNLKAANVKVGEFSRLISLDVMGIIALGHDFHGISGQSQQIFEIFQALFSSSDQKRSHFMWHNCAPPWLINMFPSKTDSQMERAYEQLRKYLEQLIPEKLASLNSTIMTDQDIPTPQIACSGDFTEGEVIPQTITTLSAGFESTASILSWTLYCLAAYPEIQDSLRKELHIAKSSSNNTALMETDYESLPLLNAVCYETSRLYPTFAMTMRKAVSDTYINGRLVQAGTYIALVPRAINRAKHLWGADAEQFLPERWIDRSNPLMPKINQLGGASSPMCMLSFLYGSRSCVGRSLALAEIRRVTARLVETFDIQKSSSAEPIPVGWLSSGPPPDLDLIFVPITEFGLRIQEE